MLSLHTSFFGKIYSSISSKLLRRFAVLFQLVVINQLFCAVHVHQRKYRVHISECYIDDSRGHILFLNAFGVDPRFLNGTIMWLLKSSDICSPTHVLQSCKWQMSQYMEGTDVTSEEVLSTKIFTKP